MIYHTIMVLFWNEADMPVINPIMPIIQIQRWVQQSSQAIEAPSHAAYILCISLWLSPRFPPLETTETDTYGKIEGYANGPHCSVETFVACSVSWPLDLTHTKIKLF